MRCAICDTPKSDISECSACNQVMDLDWFEEELRAIGFASYPTGGNHWAWKFGAIMISSDGDLPDGLCEIVVWLDGEEDPCWVFEPTSWVAVITKVREVLDR